MCVAGQMHPSDIDPLAAVFGMSSRISNTVNASVLDYAEPAKYNPAQAAHISSYLPAAEHSTPANNAVGSGADHSTVIAENGAEAVEPVEAAFPTAAAIESISTDASPCHVVPAASFFSPAGSEPLTESGVITNPLFQTSLPTAAVVGIATYTNFSTLTAIKTSSKDASNAAFHVTADSSAAAADMSSPSTAASPYFTESAGELAAMTQPVEPVAEAAATISAQYQQQQQQQPKRMRPSKDNILVARREGFTEVKESGRRTEEEKARGVQRSPDSILFKWGQHPSQLVCFAELYFLSHNCCCPAWHVSFLCADTLLSGDQILSSMQAAAPNQTLNPTSTLTTPPAAMSHSAASAPVSSRISNNPSSGKESSSATAHGNTSKSSNPEVCIAFVLQLPHSSDKVCAQYRA